MIIFMVNYYNYISVGPATRSQRVGPMGCRTNGASNNALSPLLLEYTMETSTPAQYRKRLGLTKSEDLYSHM